VEVKTLERFETGYRLNNPSSPKLLLRVVLSDNAKQVHFERTPG